MCVDLSVHSGFFQNVRGEEGLSKQKAMRKINRIAFYDAFKKSISAVICASVRLTEASIRCCWTGVKAKVFSSSEKNCASVIPKASQIFSRDGMDGTSCFRYHEEIVD